MRIRLVGQSNIPLLVPVHERDPTMTDDKNPDPSSTPDQGGHAELVLLDSFSSEIQALHAQALLEAEGIKASLVEPEGGGFGLGLDMADEFEMIVNQNDLEAAKKIIAEMEAAEEGEPVPAWTCSCGEDVDEGFGVCWSCGGEYPGE